MNTTLRNTATLVATLMAALSVHAADAGQDTYKRVVLGDTSIQAPASTEAAQRVVPGSYARHLIRNGMDRQQALSIAQAAGESPTVESASQVVTQELSGLQRYQRVMGLRSNG